MHKSPPLPSLHILPIDLHFQSFFETSWSEYYNGTLDKTSDLTDHFTIDENIWVCHCTFKSLENYNSNGAAIYKSSSSGCYNLLVEFTIFHDCNTTSFDGGAIYFNTGQCVIAYSCGYGCATVQNSLGQFCYVYVSSNNNMNFVVDSSITKTSTNYGDYTLYLWNGNVSFKGNNVSNNEVDYVSGIEIDYPSECSISFSSFRNNNSTGEVGYICMYYLSNSYQMMHTNIIENDQNNPKFGIIYTENSAELTMNRKQDQEKFFMQTLKHQFHA